MRVARILAAIALKGAEVIRISQLSAQFFKKSPIALLPLMSYLLVEVALKVGRDAIVIEQRIVYIEQENHTVAHDEPSLATRSSLSRLSTPLSPGVGQHFIRLFRPPGAGAVVGEGARGQCLPNVKYGSDYTPTRLNHVCALEECRVSDHAVIEQPFVPRAGC